MNRLENAYVQHACLGFSAMSSEIITGWTRAHCNVFLFGSYDDANGTKNSNDN